MKILVVERDLGIRTLLRDLLRTRGMEPLLAAKGDIALRMVREEAPDLIVVGSPVWIDHHIFVEELAAVSPDWACRTIVVTTHVQDQKFLQRLASANVRGVFAKPFDVEQLVAFITGCTNEKVESTAWFGIDTSRFKATI